MGKLTFVLGGARSGKSMYAQRLAEGHARQVTFIATAEALDAEMEARIESHRSYRPPHWLTLEIPHSIVRALVDQAMQSELYLLDCLSLLVSNLLLSGTNSDAVPDPEKTAGVVEAEIDSLLSAIQEGAADWIIVSNEVGMGLVPLHPLGRMYRDLLGKANQQIAAAADEVTFMVAGIPLQVKCSEPNN
jgi:adenosylcobinamide kinase / adenosylcobinamide-phosphate guanylyltransferase